METTLASTILTRVRQRTDTETSTPTTDHVSDAYLLDLLHTAYREMTDVMIDAGGTAALTVLAVPGVGTVTSGVLDLTAEFGDVVQRVIDVRVRDGNRWRPLPTRGWRDRTKHEDLSRPTWTVVGDTIIFDPENTNVTSVQVWYVPQVTAPIASTALATINAWDQYIVGHMSVEVAVRIERSPSVHQDLVKRARRRIENACRSFTLGHTETLAQVEQYDADGYDLR